MKRVRIRLSFNTLLCLLSVFLIAAGLSRYIETDSGNILIHDIEAESWEGFLYGARLFRPLQASSLNLRPAILMIPGNTADRYTCDHLAMEFARRGFVVLTMEDFSQGATGPVPDFKTENLVDAGYTFLNTRTFTDHSRIGLITFYEGAEKALAAKAFSEFTSAVFVSPQISAAEKAGGKAAIYTSLYESSQDYRIEGADGSGIRTFTAPHTGMLVSREVTAALLERFHQDLAIPNDSPFWFDARIQRSQLLIGLRFLLEILLVLICTGLGSLAASGNTPRVLRYAGGLIIPMLFFLTVSEFMNFFLISVRIGSPFHYLPNFRRITAHFSPGACFGTLLISLLWSLPIRKKGWPFFAADIIGAAGLILCLAGFLPVLSGSRSGWEMTGTVSIRWIVCLITFYACFDSLLLRTVPEHKTARICNACVTGLIFYVCCCSLFPAVLL